LIENFDYKVHFFLSSQAQVPLRNILISDITLGKHTLSVIKHFIYNYADSSQVIFKLSKQLPASSKEHDLKPTYLALLHWHLLNLNIHFRAGHMVHAHMGIKRNILKLSCESGTERTGKNKRNRDRDGKEETGDT